MSGTYFHLGSCVLICKECKSYFNVKIGQSNRRNKIFGYKKGFLFLNS